MQEDTVISIQYIDTWETSYSRKLLDMIKIIVFT